MVETTDLVFAVDSIPAIFAVTKKRSSFLPRTFSPFSALRSLYFVLGGAIPLLSLPQNRLSIVLCFIGAKMLLGAWDIDIAITTSLAVVASIILTSIAFPSSSPAGNDEIPLVSSARTAIDRPSAGRGTQDVKFVGAMPDQSGLTDPGRAADFLEPRLKQLSDPFCCRTWRPPSSGWCSRAAATKPLVIFGDYDADGVTSTALLTEVLTALGWRVNQYLPQPSG